VPNRPGGSRGYLQPTSLPNLSPAPRLPRPPPPPYQPPLLGHLAPLRPGARGRLSEDGLNSPAPKRPARRTKKALGANLVSRNDLSSTGQPHPATRLLAPLGLPVRSASYCYSWGSVRPSPSFCDGCGAGCVVGRPSRVRDRRHGPFIGPMPSLLCGPTTSQTIRANHSWHSLPGSSCLLQDPRCAHNRPCP
jgi:hypothetical protein